jgi:SpoVK/Ycf46/Vps4 family AAA+-type ATPase
MKYLIDFLESKELSKSKIYKELGCTIKECKILQFLLKEYLDSNESVMVCELLKEIYDTKDYAYLSNLKSVKNILEMGWISLSLDDYKNFKDLLEIKLLNSHICLSEHFLKLLEFGKWDSRLPEKKEYGNDLEYLKDQFLIVELHEQITNLKEQNSSSVNITKLKHKLTSMEERVQERVDVTASDLYLKFFFKQHSLSRKEKIIFLALLKEEYSGKNDELRDMNYLINMVSGDEYERMENRALLEDSSILLNKNLIDYDEILNPFGRISRRFFILEDVLYQISHQKNISSKNSNKTKLASRVKNQKYFEYLDPKTSLEDVTLEDSTRKILDTLLKHMDKKVAKRLQNWGIKDNKKGVDAKIIFYGLPGTGKTMTAHSLAKSLNKKILSFDCSKILSEYVGQSEKNARKVFDTYYDLVKSMRNKPIFLLDEADQFLGQRTSGVSSGSEKMYNQMQNIFLEQIEKFDGILIATTNMLENIDGAFSRRFNHKIEFKKPSYKQRKILWEKMLPVNCNLKLVDIEELSKYKLTGGQIKLVIKNVSYNMATLEKPIFATSIFVDEINKELKGSFDNLNQVGFF